MSARPGIAEFCWRLNIAGIVDRTAPMRGVAHVTHGQVIEAFVANRPTPPTPLVHVEDWARDWALEKAFGLALQVLDNTQRRS